VFITTPLACDLVLNQFSVEISFTFFYCIFYLCADPTNPLKVLAVSIKLNVDFVL